MLNDDAVMHACTSITPDPARRLARLMMMMLLAVALASHATALMVCDAHEMRNEEFIKSENAKKK